MEVPEIQAGEMFDKLFEKDKLISEYFESQF